MTQAAKAQEPSMEEILASIRRIIADDDNGKSRPAESPRVVASAPPPPVNEIPVPSFDAEADDAAADEVLDLTPSMEVPSQPPGFQTIAPTEDLVFEEPAAVPEPEPAASAPEPLPSPSPIETARRQFEQATGDERSMLSASTTSAVDAAFNSLAQTVLVQNSQTLDGLVREMLRPMLKTWLDDNLPSLVERLVRAEIERVSRGHG